MNNKSQNEKSSTGNHVKCQLYSDKIQILTVLSSGILHRVRFLQDYPLIQTYLFTYLTSLQVATPALHPTQANRFTSPTYNTL